MDIKLLKTLRVLLVEDELELREELCSNLSYFLENIITAVDGDDGYEKFIANQENIDLIISDINMPKINGIEMVDKIREVNKDIPIIYATAFNDTSYLLKTIEQNVSGYVLKPVDMEELLHVIQKAAAVIENRKLKEELIKQNENLEKLVEEKTKKLKIQNEKLIKQLYTDELTGLPNRKKLLEDLQDCKTPILILVDLDSFKNINDIYGEKFGNHVLQIISKRFKDFITTKECKIYRIGSDEFVLLKDKHYNKDECVDFLNFLHNEFFGTYIQIEDFDISLKINATMGLAYTKTNTLENADMALKKAKEKKSAFVIYQEDDNINKEYEAYMFWTKVIHESLEKNGVIPYFQPIFDKDKNIIKYESLMRISYNSNLYSPFCFLDISKKTKLYNALEETMLQKCFNEIVKSKINVTVNVSIEDILDERFLNFLKQNFEKKDIAKYLTFELLESENIDDYKMVIDFIEFVKSYGSQIAIDDFGSGYSNFVYLTQLHPDYIKIDGTLIKEIDKDENSKIIVQTINDFAHLLGIKTVAEYVHSESVFEEVKKLGIDYFQGFYLGEPQKW